MAEAIVIVGAGEAGARAAMALRENGFAGTVTLVGDEPHAPYERPPLSKAALLAEETPAAPVILSEERRAEHGITLLSGVAATAIDRSGHRVTLADGRALRYDRLLLATGAQARRLNGDGDSGILYLRRFAEALALRDRLRPGAHLIIIGGGFIGLEIAASARARGAAVTLVELAPRLLARAVPAAIAEAIGRRHEAAGVRVILGASVDRFGNENGKPSVILADGTRIEGDGIIAGIGAVPETRLAASAGLAIDNGIAVDAMLRTEDPDIFAAGDCCSFPHGLYGGRRIRLEAWRNAQDQGNAVARNLLGAGETYGAVPWFWSDQYELTLQIAGLADEGRETVTRDLGDGARLDFHLAADGRLVAASGIGPNGRIAKDVRLAEMLIARRAKPPREALAAPDIRLKSLLADHAAPPVIAGLDPALQT